MNALIKITAWPRPHWVSVGVLLLAIICGALIGAGQLIGAALVVAGIATAVLWLWPGVGYGVVIGSIVIGQLVRFPVPGSEGGLLINDILLPVVILVWALKRLGTRRWTIPRTAIWLPMLLWVVAMVGSLVANHNRYDGSEIMVGSLYTIRWIEYAALFLITADYARQRTTAWRIVTAVVWTGVVLSVLGFIQLQIFPDFSFMAPQGWDPHIGRLLSTWFDPNFLAGYLAALVSISLAIALSPAKKQRRWWWAATAIMGLAIVLTYSRSGYLALATGLGLVTLFRSRLVLYLGLLGVTAIFLFVPRVQERVIGIRSVDETARLRIVSWENALTIISDNPVIGVGYNLYREAQLQAGILKNPTAHSATGSDSSLLLVTATTGVVGLVAFLWLMLAIGRETIRTATEKRLSPEWRAVGLGTAAAFAALFVHSQFVNGLLYPHLMEYVWLMTAVVVMVRPENAQS